MISLAKSIYQTLAFFDAQDMPLTLWEIRFYLVSTSLPPYLPSSRTPEGRQREGKKDNDKVGMTHIGQVLDSELDNLIGHENGFYFLRGRENLARLRKKKYRICLQNYRKAKRYLGGLRFFPHLRAVAISGSLALLNSGEHSDIDLFVITKKNRIWFTRLLVSLFFQILVQRRYGQKIKGRFCLNHYVCEGQVLGEDRNFYTAVEYASLIPVLGSEIIEKFWRENAWIKEHLNSFSPSVTSPFFPLRDSRYLFSLPRHGEGAEGGRGRTTAPSSDLRSTSPAMGEGNNEGTIGRGGRGEVQRIAEFFLEISGIAPFVNWLSGIYQKRRIRREEHILVSDSELSFHPGSRGQKVLAKFSSTIAKIAP